MARHAGIPQNDPQFGMDSTRSWVVAAFLSLVMSMTMAGQQTAGVLFYGIVHTYGVSRQEASWPIVLTTTVTCFTGPIVGYLCRRYSCRIVLLICTLLAGTSVSACCFANDILILSLLFGIVYGFSVSGVYVAVNVLVSQYFEKRRATACSLIFTFSGLNMVYLPYLAELCRVIYGIRGTFLLLGALMLNAFPPVLTLRSPQWLERDTSGSITTHSEVKEPVGTAKSDDLLHIHSVQLKSSSDDYKGPVGDINADHTETEFSRDLQLLSSLAPSINQLHRSQARHKISQIVWKKLATVKFAVNALSFSIMALGQTTFLMLAVDLATDRGVVPSNAVLLVNAFGVADICVRPMSGLSIDFRILSLESVMLLGFLLQFVSCELLACLKTFPMMLASSAILGISNGCRITLVAPSLAKDFGVKSLPLMMGAVTFFNGLALVTRPFLVGYWRDRLKTYDGLLHFLAGVNAVLSLIWIVRIYIKRRVQPSRGT